MLFFLMKEKLTYGSLKSCGFFGGATGIVIREHDK